MQLHEEIEKMACLKLTFYRKNLINRVTFSKFAACVQKQIGNFKKLQKMYVVVDILMNQIWINHRTLKENVMFLENVTTYIISNYIGPLPL